MDSRWVLHLDMDAFFASVEQLTRPTLQGRPVLVGGLGGRGVVAGASYESRVFGARSAMPMHQARRLIGVTAVVLPPRGAVYSVASRRVFDTVRTVVPVVEQLSFDEAFGEPPELISASETEVEEFCAQLRRRVRDETGLIASVGAGSGKQIAKIASGLAKPDGIQVIRRADEKRLLDGLAVRKLWGIGPVAEEKLHRLGIETIGQLAALSEAEAANILGATIGPALHRLARGIDDRPVAERAVAKQISAESTFATDLTTLDELREAIAPIAEHAHQRLCRDGRGARTVTVKLKKSDMSTLTRSATLPYATTDAAALAAMARRLLLDPRQIGPIRLLGVGFSGLSHVLQESLFPDLELAASDTDAGAETAQVAPGRRRAGNSGRPSRGGWATTSRIASSGTAGYRVPATAWSRCGSKPGARARATLERSHPTPPTSPRRTRSTASIGPITLPLSPTPRQSRRSTTSCSGKLRCQRRHHQHPRLTRRQPRDHHRSRVDQVAAGTVIRAYAPTGNSGGDRDQHSVAAVSPYSVDHRVGGIARTERFQHEAAGTGRYAGIHGYGVTARVGRDDVDSRGLGRAQLAEECAPLGQVEHHAVIDGADQVAGEAVLGCHLAKSQRSEHPAGETHQHPQIAGGGIRRHRNRVPQIRRAVGVGRVGAAHGAGQHQRNLATVGDVQP